MTAPSRHYPPAKFLSPRTTCNTTSTPLLLLFVTQAALITVLVLAAGMAPAPAAGLVMAVLVGDVYALTDQHNLIAAAGRLVAMARVGQ